MEAPRPAHTSSPWETTPAVRIHNPYAAEPGLLVKAPSKYDGSTQKTITKIISFADHIPGAPPGEPDFLVIQRKINGHSQTPIRKVVFRDTREPMHAWILRVLTAELKLINTDDPFVTHEVIKLNSDSKSTLNWLVYRFEGSQCEVSIEYGYHDAKKEAGGRELPDGMDEVESRYRVRSRL